jgi:hypothetical protein
VTRAALAAVAVCAAGLCLSPVRAWSDTIAVPSQSDGGGVFCTNPPTAVDPTVPATVNALGLTVPETGPIAVLDSGVDGSVPELAGRVTAQFDALAGVEGDASDADGHGTEVAGVAAGAPGLVVGVSPTSPIMAVRIFSRYGATTTKALVAGINWAVAHGASVVTVATSSPLSGISGADVTATTRAIGEAFNKGVLVVAAVGSEGADQADFPSSLPHVVAVGATNADGTRATFSDTGPWVDLVARGASLIAPTALQMCQTGYGYANSASFGAPAVAAAVAILKQMRPGITSSQLFAALRSSAHDLSLAGRDDETGFGLLDVPTALAVPLAPIETSPEVDDDPFFVRGAYAAGHPTRLARSRKETVKGDLSPAKDPSDVYPVRLSKGDRFAASARVTGADSLAMLNLWKPTVGDFDVSNEATKQRIVSTGGFAVDPQLVYRVTKSGTYFVSIETTDAVDEDDPQASPPIAESYQLTFARTKLKPTKTKKPKKPAKKKTKTPSK